MLIKRTWRQQVRQARGYAYHSELAEEETGQPEELQAAEADNQPDREEQDTSKDTAEVAEQSDNPSEDSDMHGGDGASGEVEDPEDSQGSEEAAEEGGQAPADSGEMPGQDNQDVEASEEPEEEPESEEDPDSEESWTDRPDEDEYDDPDESESDYEDNPGEHNNRQAFDLDDARDRRLSAEFSRVIAKVAEDLEGHPVEGDDEWDIEALMKRTFDRRPLAGCRQSREKVGVVLCLDNSGSCAEQAHLYAKFADAATKTGDVEMYLTPNGGTVARYDKKQGRWINDNTPWWEMRGRTILFFGDFDGADAPVIASRRNKVYWFSNEGRYEEMNEHNWCSFSLADFRGKYHECFDEQDFLKIAKKIR